MGPPTRTHDEIPPRWTHISHGMIGTRTEALSSITHGLPSFDTDILMLVHIPVEPHPPFFRQPRPSTQPFPHHGIFHSPHEARRLPSRLHLLQSQTSSESQSQSILDHPARSHQNHPGAEQLSYQFPSRKTPPTTLAPDIRWPSLHSALHRRGRQSKPWKVSPFPLQICPIWIPSRLHLSRV